MEKQKRSAKRNVHGNVVGYEGGRRVGDFGNGSILWAALWVKGVEKEAAFHDARRILKGA